MHSLYYIRATCTRALRGYNIAVELAVLFARRACELGSHECSHHTS